LGDCFTDSSGHPACALCRAARAYGGWPDWAFFRPIDYCLLWAVTWKLQT
jgi:hypothetical protein